MGRLTYKESDGTFGVAGMNAENQEEKLYACVCKLLKYEDTGLSPDDVDKLKWECEDLRDAYEKARRGAAGDISKST